MSKITFGLTDKNISIIEKHIGKFEGALFTHSIWIRIAKEIGWDALTACLHYFKYLERKDRDSLLDEKIGGLFSENAETIIVPNKPMLYTVGDSLVYDKLFGIINSTPMKLGKSNRYAGGTCFVSYEDAKAAIERISVLDIISKYKVYGLDCWLENTYELDGLLLLLTDTELIKLND